MWKPVIHNSLRQTSAKPLKGVLLEVSEMTPTARIYIAKEDTVLVVDFPWSERNPHTVDFLHASSECFRIEVDVLDNRVVGYVLCVHPEKFETQMKGPLAAEAQVLAYLTHAFKSGTLPTQPSSFRHNGESYQVGTELYKTDESLGWNASYPMQPHQIHSVLWMQHKEHAANRIVKFKWSLPIANTKWSVDIQNESFVMHCSNVASVKVQGGILNDGTGMGKTAAVLRLIAETRHLNFMSDGLYKSNATLIIVPINLPMQWMSEFQKFLGSRLAIVRLIQGKDLKHVSMETLLQADVVLTTFAFLRNSKPYLELFERMWPNARSCNEKRLSNRTRSSISAWRRIESQTLPILEAVQWKRVIIDEIHESFEVKQDLKMMQLFHFDFAWGLTATLDLQHDRLSPLLHFLLGDDLQLHLTHPCRTHRLLTMQVRGTPSPHDWTHSLHLIPLNDIERKEILKYISEAFKSDDLVRICNHVGIEQENDFTYSPNRVLNGHLHHLDDISSRCQTLISRLIHSYVCTIFAWHLERLLNEVIDFDMESLSSLHSMFTESVRDMKSKERQIHLARANLDNILNEEICSICMTDPCNAITCCGHIFCKNCIFRNLEINTCCPTCRFHPLKPDEVRIVSSTESSGSKIWALVNMVCEMKERVIIFAQWKDLLRLIRTALKIGNVKAQLLEGTTMQRANLIEHFVSDNRGVLLICIQDSFSGLHLPFAKHIIFAHAFVGEIGRVQSWEHQAVARTIRPGCSDDVKVHSFVLAETEEEKVWKQTHP